MEIPIGDLLCCVLVEPTDLDGGLDFEALGLNVEALDFDGGVAFDLGRVVRGLQLRLEVVGHSVGSAADLLVAEAAA